MAEETLTLPCDSNHSLEYHIVTLFEKLEDLRREKKCNTAANGADRQPMQTEVRTLEFWRSIISECMASFFYVFIVCGAAAGAGVGATLSSVLLATALAAGFAMTTLTHCFAHISGAHVNPAVTLAMAVTRNVSPVRAAMFLIAQCGGGIAGAAVLYGVTVPGYTGNLAAAVAQSAQLAPWERFGVEFVLTFIVVFTYFVSMDTYRKWLSSSAVTIGAAYSTCTFVSMPYLNPARSLGPAFVLNKWDNHWVYWFGPMVGGVLSGLIYEFIFNPRRYSKCRKSALDGETSSIHSDEENYDDLDKATVPKFHGSNYNTYRSAMTGTLPGANTGAGNYCPSLASASVYSTTTNAAKLNRVESLYGGTKSLYCKSPPLTRANLNRSQSVYTKSNCNVNLLPRPGPLVPAQSLYPMRLNQQQTHVQNQNVQNQMQQCSENIYGVRAVTSGSSNRSESNYGTNNRSDSNYPTATAGNVRPDNYAPTRTEPTYNTGGNRPEPAYGTNGPPSNRSDSTYGTSGTISNRSDSYPNSNNTNRSDPEYPTNSRSDGNYPSNNRSEATASYGTSTMYETRTNTNAAAENRPEDNKKCNARGNRPDSMYGLVVNQQRRGPNITPEESYLISAAQRNAPVPNGNYIGGVIAYKPPNHGQGAGGSTAPGQTSAYPSRTMDGSETMRPSPPTSVATTSAVFHHQRLQHSPNTQY